MVLAEWFVPEVPSVDLEVNSQARRFWASLGFKPYCTTMKLNPF
jgi:hypothetical protein